MPLLYTINITVDGCVDHRAVKADEIAHRFATEAIQGADALIFGRVTYEMMEGAWREPFETGRKADWMDEWMLPFAQALGPKKKFVVSSTFESTGWNAEPVRGSDLEATVRRLKAEPGQRLYTGGVTLPRRLAELGLIDEYEFLVHPRFAGYGPKLFDGLAQPLDLQLTGRRKFPSGAVALRYEPQPPSLEASSTQLRRAGPEEAEAVDEMLSDILSSRRSKPPLDL